MSARVYVTAFLVMAGAAVMTVLFVGTLLALSEDTGAGVVDDEDGE